MTLKGHKALWNGMF